MLLAILPSLPLAVKKTTARKTQNNLEFKMHHSYSFYVPAGSG